MFISRLESYLESLGKQTYEKQYLINCLKDYLQLYVLEFIYNDPLYREFIFTGGTALQKCYGLDRLSENIDIDFLIPIDHVQLSEKIRKHFKNLYGFENLSVSIKGKQKIIYLKFPILKQLSLVGSGESEQVFVKLKDLLRKRVTSISPRDLLFDVKHLFQNSQYIEQISLNYHAIVLPLIDEMH